MIRMLSKPVQPRTMSAMLSIGYFLVGLATVSRQYTFDAISYLSDVENTHLDFFIHPQSITYNFFHSQHLLFSLFVYLFWHFWQLFGYHGSALLPAQLLNLIEGSVTLGITY